VALDHVEIKALCDAFRWNVEVAYLGGHSQGDVNFVKIPETSYPGSKPVVLLYRCVFSTPALGIMRLSGIQSRALRHLIEIKIPTRSRIPPCAHCAQ
jgi:hypothetical protein